ncbi:hypothetical protein [Thalassospira sp.]|uniref:hypothetical protein n=1 Tax=Thalassospira sp. TaxID=1912094 RepID=UPI003AA9A69D
MRSERSLKHFKIVRSWFLLRFVRPYLPDSSLHYGCYAVSFFGHPTKPVPFEELASVEDERNWLEPGAVDSVASNVQWGWQTLQNDFKEEMSTGQIIANAIVTAVPVVEQVADMRDLAANGKLLILDK